MTSKKILVLNGHPGAESLSGHLAHSYAEAARAGGHEVKILELNELNFDPDFEFGSFKNVKQLEPDLERFMGALEWAEHFVMTTPMWWGGLPAKLKGLFDRAFLPGRTFDTRNSNWLGMPKPMLTGKTGRIILTSDTPGWFFWLRYSSAMKWQLKGQIFEFVGISPVRMTYFSGASHPGDGVVEKWTGELQGLGAVGA